MEFTLQTNVTVGAISNNFDELKAEIAKVAENYKGLVVQDADGAKTAKEELAYLRKFTKQVNDRRIAVGKEFDAPKVAFEAEVKAMLAPVNEVIAEIDGELKAYEQGETDKKWAEIHAIIDKALADVDPATADYIRGFASLNNPKWENKGETIQKITKDIEEQITVIQNGVAVIKQTTEENLIPDLLWKYKETGNLSEALLYKDELKAQKAQVEAVGKTVAPSTATETEESTVCAVFKFKGTRSAIQSVLDYAKANGVEYTQIRKEG